MYEPTYDDTHTAILVDSARNKRSKRQRGYSEVLLCEECEALFNRWETYFANIWFNPMTRLRPTEVGQSTVNISGIDYSRFKLFHLSIIWRAGVCGLREFSMIRLGGQQEQLRSRLLAADAGEPANYPFCGLALRDPETGGFQDKLVKLLDTIRIDGHYAYTALFGGVLWLYFISKHAGSHNVPRVFDRSGKLRLDVQDWTESLIVRDMASRIPHRR